MTQSFSRKFLVLLAATAFTIPATLAEAQSTYKVRRGDTLAAVAGRLGVDMDDLAKANGLKRPYRLQAGQTLKTGKTTQAKSSRSSSARKSASAKPTTYTVARGDTLFGIADKFDVTVEELRKANGLGRRATLQRGQKLKLPGAGERASNELDEPLVEPRGRATTRASAAEGEVLSGRAAPGRVVTVAGPAKTYRVRKGDNATEVAQKLGVSLTELARENKLKRPYRLQPGQVLRGERTTARAYVVASGDTVSEVARRFSVSESALRGANGLRRGASLSPGRRLTLPAGYRDRGPQAPTTRVATVEPPASAFRPPATPVAPSAEGPAPPLPGAPQPYAGVRPPSQRYTAPPATPSAEGPAPPLPSAPQPYAAVRPPSQRYTPPPRATQPYVPPPSSAGVFGAPTQSPQPSDSQLSQMGQGVFIWPVKGSVISGFGAKPGGQRNDGVNIKASEGDPVRAAASGDVVYAGDQVPGFGNLVLIKHADGWVTAYGHLSRVGVRMQQKVSQGQEIGQAGASGGVGEPQVHFEVRYAPNPQERAKPIDPTLVLPRG